MTIVARTTQYFANVSRDSDVILDRLSGSNRRVAAVDPDQLNTDEYDGDGENCDLQEPPHAAFPQRYLTLCRPTRFGKPSRIYATRLRA
jgi:hypothetical protein